MVEICDLVNVRTCILIFFVLEFIITIIAFQWRALTNSHGRLPKKLVQMDFFILFLLFVVDVNSDICFLFFIPCKCDFLKALCLLIVYICSYFFFPLKIEAAPTNTCKCKEQEWKVPPSTPRWCSWLPLGFYASHGSPLWSSEYSIQFYFCIPKGPGFNLVWPAGGSCHGWPCQAKEEDCWRCPWAVSPVENAGW